MTDKGAGASRHQSPVSRLERWTDLRTSLKALAALTVVVIMVVATIVLIPWHMDEYIMYKSLACWQPEQQLNVYRESCTAYTTTLGPIEFQRAYAYVGISSSLLLAPFHLAVASTWTPYVVGAAVLVAVALGLTRALALPTRISLVPIVFFPTLFTVLHDGGPVRLALLALAWTPVMVARFVNTGNAQRLAWGAAITLMWVVAAEDKPFFLYLIPGIAVFTLAALSSRGVLNRARSAWRSLAILLVTASTLPIVLLFAMRTEGDSYLQFLRTSAPAPGLGLRALNAVQGALFTVDWPYYAHRVSTFQDFGSLEVGGLAGKILSRIPFLPGFMTTQAKVATALTVMVAIAVLVLYWRAAATLHKSQGDQVRNTSLLLLAAAATLWAGAWISGGWATHHYVFAQIPLAGLLMYAAVRQNHGLRNLLAALVALAMAILTIIWLTPTQPTASREIPKAFAAAIDVAGTDTIINCSSWGCYFTYSLANEKNVPVVFADTLEHTTALESVAQTDAKRILHLCTGCTLMSVGEMYPRSDVLPIDSDTEEWQVFQVTPN